MYTKPSLGTGFAGVFAHAVAAGIIASRSGSAITACAVFRNVRLGNAFFVRNMESPLSSQTRGGFTGGRFCTPHLERNAFHDTKDHRRETIPVFRDIAADFSNSGRVIVLDASTEREGHQFLGQRRGEEIGRAS